MKSLSRVRLFVTPWTAAYQALPSMGFSRQECWSGLPFPSPGDLPNPGIEPKSPILQQTLYRLSHQGMLGYIKIIYPLLELNLQICPLSVPPPTFWVLTLYSAHLSSFSLKSWKLFRICVDGPTSFVSIVTLFSFV